MGYFDDYEGNVEDIPTEDGFTDGVYEVKIQSVKDHENEEKDSKGIMVNLECVDPESKFFGVTHMWWINVPRKHKFDDKAKYNNSVRFFKKALLDIGVPEDEVGSWNATDGAATVINNYGTARIRTKNGFTNVDFKLDGETREVSSSTNNAPAKSSPSPTSQASEESIDLSSFLNG